jgi:mannitol-1-phosphate 5-dehydrogenase
VKVAVIGAGRIGLGLVAASFRGAGHDVVVICRSRGLARAVRAGYRVDLADGTGPGCDTIVEGVGAVATRRPAEVRDALAEADLIATAVPPAELRGAARQLEDALVARRRPATILCFENTVGAGRRLRALTLAAASSKKERRRMKRHAYSSALALRIVTHRAWHGARGEPLRLVGDLPEQFVIEAGPAAELLDGFSPAIAVDGHAAWVLRKLYIFSAGHASAGYLGWLKGYHYVHTSIADPEVRGAVAEAMEEGQRGIAHRFGPTFAGGPADLAAIVERFANPHLNDPVCRVAHDPRRKLAISERLLGAAAAARESGIEPRRLLQVAAAAMCFADPGAEPLATCIGQEGLQSLLWRVCALDPASSLAAAMSASWDGLGHDWSPGSRLLSLERGTWAWGRADGELPAT